MFGYDSAERAWLTPPEPFGCAEYDEPEEDVEPEYIEKATERMVKNAEMLHRNRPDPR